MSTTETVASTFTHRTHRAGGFLLMVAGVISAIVGLALLIVAASGGTLPLGVSSLVAGLLGGYVLVFAVIEFVAGVLAYRGRDWYASMTGGILGMFGLVTLPLDLIGVILISLGEGQFDRPTSTRVETTQPSTTGTSSTGASH